MNSSIYLDFQWEEIKLELDHMFFIDISVQTRVGYVKESSWRKDLNAIWCGGYFWADLNWCDMMVGTLMYVSWIFIQWSLLSPLTPGICIILVHLLIKFKLHFLPESVAVVSLGEYFLNMSVTCCSVQSRSSKVQCLHLLLQPLFLVFSVKHIVCHS